METASNCSPVRRAVVAIRFLVLAGLLLTLAGPAEARTFTYFNGRKVEGDLVGMTGNQVTIRVGGRPLTLPIGFFSLPDQKFIRESVAAGNNPAAPTPAAPTLPGAKSATTGKADERVKLGAVFFLEFPDLPKDRRGELTKMQVRIPARYDAARKYPLIIWMGGSDGGNTTGSCSALVEPDDFICAGLPYPKGASNPKQDNMVGDFKKIWKYHHTMLEALHRTVPNIDMRLRIIGGFSNGAHCIDGLLDEAKDYVNWFNVFVLVEGGGHAGHWTRKENQFTCVLWGDKSPNKALNTGENCIRLAKCAKMTLMSEEMKGVGHEFPQPYQAKVREWIEKTVIPGTLGGGKS
ncbi:MAG: hypothetical protein NTY01_21740 [Verrucomicrobia bacterium]|nr:hypothetical protein [Verrucomicrobiota bacterium]